ncbi:unnamed protein product [Onchocerca flexuosa]|uniref:Ovule protein n=1 Tax=Onchocerca flexuosa TaxID=387005 RepID=A0A183H2R5_9BILA|nr:unnamed protein product [Onchocerca flexuosa]
MLWERIRDICAYNRGYCNNMEEKEKGRDYCDKSLTSGVTSFQGSCRQRQVLSKRRKDSPGETSLAILVLNFIRISVSSQGLQ